MVTTLCLVYLPFFWQFVFVSFKLSTFQMGQPTLGYQLRFAGLSGPRDKPTSHVVKGELRSEPGTAMFNGVWGRDENKAKREEYPKHKMISLDTFSV